MSAKKDKLIEEAQRLVLRGQIDKAVKAYEQIVVLEPSALNHRQRLAELLIKSGRDDDARTEFETIGRKYTADGFYLKAISVYKRLQGLFPGDIQISLTLAGLNEKHGLIANALAEYRQVYELFEKNGSTAEALEVLEKMQGVDPHNINIMLKLAEAYIQAGKRDESYSVFSRLAGLMQERGDSAAFARLNERIKQLFPHKSGFVLDILAEQVEGGNAANAVVSLQSMLRTCSSDRRVWELVIKAFRMLNQPQKVKMAYQHYLKCLPEEPSAQLGVIGCLLDESDVNGVLALLDQYEIGLCSKGLLGEVEGVYAALDRLDPINEHVLSGYHRICVAAGRSEAAAALQAKIESLHGVSGNRAEEIVEEKESAFVEPDYFSRQPEPVDDFNETSFADVDADLNALLDDEPSLSADLSADIPDADAMEIEVELDSELDFDIPEVPSDADDHDWLDEVGGLFDSIVTKPRGVKFADGHVEGDAQSHYDLGVAFREMGLYDEAINEFRNAAADSSRRLECLILQGACLREKGDCDHAVKALTSLLKPGLSLDDASAVKYELALTFGVKGPASRMLELFQSIEAANPGFRDVRTRLSAINADAHVLDLTDGLHDPGIKKSGR